MKMKNKVLIKLIIPSIEEELDLYLPLNKSVGKIIELLKKSLPALTDKRFEATNFLNLYNKYTGKRYDLDIIILNTDIRNGSVLIFI